MTAAPPEMEHDAIPPQTGPGKLLHDARVAANLSIVDVAAQLHLDAATIEALEGDDYAKLPAPAFVRGYLRSYARLLNLAPGPVVDAYSSQGFEPPALVADISSGAQAQPESTDLPWRLMTVVIVGVLITLVVMWWRSNMNDPFSVIDNVVGLDTPEAVSTPGADTSLAYSVPAEPESIPTLAAPLDTTMDSNDAEHPPPASGAPLDATPATADTAESFASVVVPVAPTPTPTTTTHDIGTGDTDTLDDTPGASAPSAGDESAEAAVTDVTTTPPPGPTAVQADDSVATATLAAVPSVASADSANVSNAPPGTLLLAFTNDSWVEVYDGAGERLFFGMARAGRQLDLEGTPPLKVLLGYARDIRVEYNGRPIDYASFVNRGIARFVITAEGARGENDIAVDEATSQQ